MSDLQDVDKPLEGLTKEMHRELSVFSELNGKIQRQANKLILSDPSPDKGEDKIEREPQSFVEAFEYIVSMTRKQNDRLRMIYEQLDKIV